MILIAAAAIVLIVGTIIGFVIGRRSNHLAQKLNTAEAELTEAQQQLSGYQSQVSDHFQKTADLFTDLTQHYQDVYKHLALGAQTLCQDGAVQDQLRLLKSNLNTNSDEEATAAVFSSETQGQNPRREPYVSVERASVYPKDYATEV